MLFACCWSHLNSMLWLSKQNSTQSLLLGVIGLRIETPSKKLNITGAKHVFMSKMADAVTPKLKSNSLGNNIHRFLRKQKILTDVHFYFSANQGWKPGPSSGDREWFLFWRSWGYFLCRVGTAFKLLQKATRYVSTSHFHDFLKFTSRVDICF